MKQTTAIALTSSSMPEISDAKSLAEVRLNKAIPHYKDLAQPKRVTWLKEQIMTLNMIRHQVVEDFQLEFDAKVLDDFIMADQYTKDCSFPEIKNAFMRGMMGSYGDYYGLTAESLYGFLRGYLRSPMRQEAAKIVRDTLRGEELQKGSAYMEKLRFYAEQMQKNNTI